MNPVKLTEGPNEGGNLEGLEVFARVDAALRQVLAKAATVIEINSKVDPSEATPEELTELYETMQREAAMVPETLFYWPMQKQYVVAFEVDGETWIYRAEDLTGWGMEFSAKSGSLPPLEDPL